MNKNHTGSGTLERLAEGSSPVHRLHPGAKLFSALVYIIAVVSVGRYDLPSLLPLAAYPFILMPLSDTPASALLPRILPALPFAALAGVSNLIFDRSVYSSPRGFIITGGAVSFAVILVKTAYAVTAALLLAATTPQTELFSQLRRMKVPSVVVAALAMTLRYLGTLSGEASRLGAAYSLRSGKDGGVDIKNAGSFTGGLLLRASARASRIGGAMECRGGFTFTGGGPAEPVKKRFGLTDFAFCAAVAALSALALLLL